MASGAGSPGTLWAEPHPGAAASALGLRVAQREAPTPQPAAHGRVIRLTFLVMLTWKPKGCGMGMGTGAVPPMVTQSHAVQLQPNPTALRAGAA